MKKLIWNKIFKNQGKCFSGGYYAESPISDHVYITTRGIIGWNTYIIFKKHLPLIQKFSIYMLAEDLLNGSQSVIDCFAHTLKEAKYEFQSYVYNKYSKNHKFSFYTLKSYLEEIKIAKKNASGIEFVADGKIQTSTRKSTINNSESFKN